jgi:hypothetical protein
VSFFRRAGALIARFFTSAADPGAAAGEFQLYSKVDGGGDSQLFGRSDNGTAYQITPPAVAGTQYVFVYQPGGVAVDNVYTDWSLLYAALSLIEGERLVEFDSTFTSPCVIPAGAYTLKDVIFTGTWTRPNTDVTFDVGVITTGLRHIRTSLRITAADPTTAPIADFTNTSNVMLLDDGVTVIFQFPIIDFSGLSGEDQGYLNVRNGSQVLGAVPQPITTGACTLTVTIDGANSQCGQLTVNPGTGTVIVHVTGGPGMITTAPTNGGQFLVSGAMGQLPAIFVAGNFFGATNPDGVVFVVDTSGGPVTCLNMRGTAQCAGSFVAFKKSDDANPLTILTGSGDTIDGLPSYTVTAAKGEVTLVSDGVSNWMVMSTSTSSTLGGSQCLIFRPGSGLVGPVVFDTWAALYAQLTNLRAQANGSGCYTIQFDLSTSASFLGTTIPAGVYNMTAVTWVGTGTGVVGVGTPPTSAVFAEGATFTGGPLRFESLLLYSRATATPPFTITNTFNDVIEMNNVIVQTETSPIPVFNVSGGGFAQFHLTFTDFSGGTGNPTLQVGAGSSANLRLGPGGFVGANTFITTADGGISITLDASTASYNEDQPLAPGAALAPDDDVNDTFTRHFTTDILVADDNAYPQYLNRFDGYTDPPPVASLPQALLSDNRYQWVLVKETSGQPSLSGTGDLGITIQPFAGDSIDGVLGPLLLLPGSQVALISRGDGNWNSAWKTAGVPEKVFASVVINPSGGVEKRIAYFNVGNATPGSGVVKNATGDWTITFNNPFLAGYFPIVTTGLRGDSELVFVNYNTIDNSNMQILTYNAAGVLTDPNYINVVVHLAPEIID